MYIVGEEFKGKLSDFGLPRDVHEKGYYKIMCMVNTIISKMDGHRVTVVWKVYLSLDVWYE